MNPGITRAVPLLLAGVVAACGGRSARHHGAPPDEPGRCEEPLVFSDPAVDAAVRMRANLTPDQAITAADVKDLRDLYVLGATSLDGLECLPALESLTAREGPIESIEPLAGLRKLDWLDLSANAISDLSPLTGHTELRWIDLTRNAIRELSPLASNPVIDDLRFDFNQVTSLEPLSGIPIAILLGTNNQISDLSPLATMGSFLREVSLSYNPIGELPPLAENTQLEILRLDATELEDISKLERKVLLQRLHLDHNRIRDLRPLSAFPELSSIHARDNLVESLDGVTLPEPGCSGGFELVDNPIDASDVAALCATGWVIRYGNSLSPEQCNMDCLL